MKFKRNELPVASEMISLAESAHHPFQEFMCYWVAFNNIYTTNAFTVNKVAEYSVGTDGAIVTKTNQFGLVQPKFKAVTEKEQINLLINEYDDIFCKNFIIDTDQVSFFLKRTPRFDWDRPVEIFQGQKVNGVLNVGYTTNFELPVWAGLQSEVFDKIRNSKASNKEIHSAFKQVVLLIYTIRNNLFHGGKRSDDANDVNVVSQAIPLLKMLIDYFIETEDA